MSFVSFALFVVIRAQWLILIGGQRDPH